MVRTFKRLTATVAFLLLIAGCQAMTGETAGQNIDDGTLTTYVKTQLAGERLNTLSRRDQQRHCVPYRRSRDRHGEVARWNGCLSGQRCQTGCQQPASYQALKQTVSA